MQENVQKFGHSSNCSLIIHFNDSTDNIVLSEEKMTVIQIRYCLMWQRFGQMGLLSILGESWEMDGHAPWQFL